MRWKYSESQNYALLHKTHFAFYFSYIGTTKNHPGISYSINFRELIVYCSFLPKFSLSEKMKTCPTFTYFLWLEWSVDITFLIADICHMIEPKISQVFQSHLGLQCDPKLMVLLHWICCSFSQICIEFWKTAANSLEAEPSVLGQTVGDCSNTSLENCVIGCGLAYKTVS